MKKFSMVIVYLFSSLMLLFIAGCSENTTDVNVQHDALFGTWKFDKYTEYYFDGYGQGKLFSPSSEYDFKYTIDDSLLKIDFADESADDSTYEICLDETKLTLKSEDANKGLYVLEKTNE